MNGSSDATVGNNCVSLANNGQHAVRKYSLGDWAGLDGALTNGVNAANTQLDIHVYETSTDDLPDVRVFDSDYGNNGVYAWVDCPANNSAMGFYDGSTARRWCRGQYLRVNAHFRSQFPGQHFKLIAHELGHTIGLEHRNDETGFMHSDANVFASAASTRYTTHDQNHISAEPQYD